MQLVTNERPPRESALNIHARRALSLVVCLILLISNGTTQGQTADVVINEFLAANRAENRDPDFAAFSDWIELYNNADTDIDLSGYTLTDDLDEPFKWQIPTGTLIPGGGYLLLWADGEDTGLHTSFKLNRGGEQLGLHSPAGILVDALTFGAQQEDMSYGRLGKDGTAWAFFDPPTPGKANDSRRSVDVTPEPVFSITGGLHAGPQWLTFLNTDQIDVYYSLDGTPPDDHALPYHEPIALNATTAVRAIGYTRDLAPSAIVTHTYFIDEEISLPLVSIVTDPANFFSNERGIYVTGTRGTGGYCDGAIRNLKQDWERPVNVELYEANGDLGLNQRAGVKIFGGCSRHRFPQKSLALFARSVYGKGSFRYQLFPDKDIDRFESFILRSSADDQVFTLFRDALSQTVLVEHMDVDVQAYRPALLFLNGEYWGIHNLREKVNEHYCAGNFGIEAAEVNLLESNGVVAAGTNAGYSAMVNYANTRNLADPDAYAVIAGQMDIDQYIDYQIGHIYLAERDWPGNNIKFWRANSGPYTRWRWINFDMDQCFTAAWTSENMMTKTTTRTGAGWPNPEWSTRLFRSLLENEGFRNEFVQRYAYHMNTTFNPDRLLGIIDQLQGVLTPEIPRHIVRWGGQRDPDALETWQSSIFNSVTRWEQNVDVMRRFAVERPTLTRRHFIDHFGLSGTSELGLNLAIPRSGVLQINGKRLPDGFLGTYFNDMPLSLAATPRLGYRFSHWEMQSFMVSTETIIPMGALWKYSDVGANLGTAWRQGAYDDSAWPTGPAQLGYGDRDEATILNYGGDAGNEYVTTYFRRAFDLTQVTPFRSLTISLLVDDGAVAYLNGQEIVRINMPSGRFHYLTPAPRAISDENAFTEFHISPVLLRSGTNTLAVEIHQTTGSSDISFDCSLVGRTAASARSARYVSPEVGVTLSGDAQFTAFFEVDPTPIPDPVVITEINYSSASEADSADWVELYNRSDAAIDLTGWQFSDSAEQVYEFPKGTLLWPDDHLVLCRDRIKFKSHHPHVKNLFGNFEFGLSSAGESIRLVDRENNVIDSVAYGVIAPWPQTARGTGYTIELIDIASDNSLGENWRAVTLYGTPGMPRQ